MVEPPVTVSSDKGPAPGPNYRWLLVSEARPVRIHYQSGVGFEVALWVKELPIQMPRWPEVPEGDSSALVRLTAAAIVKVLSAPA